ncbi:hypothetical protein HanIR_Chr05g0223041 [Helianthus annuus]|nr:hypothetical protein HanIR_Chr05g0223041 [Helianthus annuus]
MAKMIVSDEARKEFSSFRRAFEEVNSTIKTKFSQVYLYVSDKISNAEKAMVGGLGALNLFGVIVLGTMNMTVSPSGFISFVSEIFPLLQIYDASFFAIPLVQWFITQRTNAQIEKRNRTRERLITSS